MVIFYKESPLPRNGLSSRNFENQPFFIPVLARREASLLVLSKKGSRFAIARISFCASNHSSSSLSAEHVGHLMETGSAADHPSGHGVAKDMCARTRHGDTGTL